MVRFVNHIAFIWRFVRGPVTDICQSRVIKEREQKAKLKKEKEEVRINF